MLRQYKFAAFLGGLLSAGLCVGAAEAATANAAFGVSVTITAGCTTGVATDAFAGAGDWTSGVTVTCSNSAPHSLRLDPDGSAAVAATAPRAFDTVTMTVTY